MAFPKIIYPVGGGTTLTFQSPARFVPYRQYEVQRTDNVSSAGVLETVFERVDKFTSFTMEYVRETDISGWASFVDYAITGQSFDFYPDASDTGTHTTYTMWDHNWKADWKQLGMRTFQLIFRERVGWP